ncbi:ATP phosphoribosyltransferase [Anoxybacter fermentans]|uniref:ATP phosphoribosyltransferase n=1 Tax=Anoxybacter fermentans TaxID=1323375 RepID=A0A3Q9HRD1_9FIRM|nr:ATP phosphoribosyltransferase [Anoxybacter fermentans]AZR74032.1 ATP phosphoribosyltransferase [Anoxybacter fermentans]
MDRIRIALAKGRLAEDAVKLLKKAGYRVPHEILSSRKLIFNIEDEQVELVLVKPADVPIYVEYGAADLGIVGRDILLEEGRSLYEVLDLKFGQCKFVLAGLPGFREKQLTHRRVATKYPRFAKEYFRKKGEPVEVIELTGSIELAPLTGLADWIVDIMQTGRTLKENGLMVYEDICPVSARLVVNRVSMKTRRKEINKLIERLKSQVERSEN